MDIIDNIIIVTVVPCEISFTKLSVSYFEEYKDPPNFKFYYSGKSDIFIENNFRPLIFIRRKISDRYI